MVFTVVEASPPGSAYTPGETLAPSCSPGDTNCKVALTSGSVLFSNGTDLITQDNGNFYWDDTNNRLGIGTTTPSYKLTILGDLFVNTSSTLGNVISGVWQGTAIGDSYVSSAATWNAKITTSSLSVAYSPLSYNNSTGVFSLPTSTASQSGFLSSTDWTTFNNKQSLLTFPLAAASSSAAGATTQVIYNNAGLNAGDSNFTWASSTQLLTITGTSTISGNVGIGTTTPASKLTVLGDLFVNTSSTLGNVISGTWQGTAIADAYISSASNWNAKITTSSLSVAYGPLSYNNSTGVFSLPTSTASQSGFLSSADWTTFNNKQSQLWGLSGSNLFASSTSWRVGIGTTTPGAKLTVYGTNSIQTEGLRIESDTGAWRNIYLGAGDDLYFASNDYPYLTTAGVWTDASDISIKKDIEPLHYGLEDLMKLQPRNYRMKDDDMPQIGFIAQEVENIIPEVVSGEEGRRGLATSHLSALTVKAIQEITNIIDLISAPTTTPSLVINNLGNVGIGTTNPTAKLQVSGQIYQDSAGTKMIFKSPDGTCSACGPDNADVWTCANVACP